MSPFALVGSFTGAQASVGVAQEVSPQIFPIRSGVTSGDGCTTDEREQLQEWAEKAAEALDLESSRAGKRAVAGLGRWTP